MLRSLFLDPLISFHFFISWIQFPQKDQEEIFEFNMPRTYFVDIETEIVDGFPKPEEAKSRILTFSIITPERKAIVLGLEDLSPDQIKKIEDDTNAHFKDYDQDWEFSYYKFKMSMIWFIHSCISFYLSSL